MVAELNNTFGERQPELLHGGGLAYEHDKHLHVSPFFGLDRLLRVRLLGARRAGLGADPRPRGRDASADAVLHGRRRELTNRAPRPMLIRYPLMPAQVDRR